MRTLKGMLWIEANSGGKKFRPSEKQVKKVRKFLRIWGVPVNWVMKIVAHDQSNLGGVPTEDVEYVEISAIHPNVPEEVGAFYLTNTVDDRSRTIWCWGLK